MPNTDPAPTHIGRTDMLGRFWQHQADEQHRRAQIKRMLAELPVAGGLSDSFTEAPELDLAGCADAATTRIAAERYVDWHATPVEASSWDVDSPHAMLCGKPDSDLMLQIKWLDMLMAARAQGAQQLTILDFHSPVSAPAVDVDVELGLYAAQLDVLDALAPLLRSSALVEETKGQLHHRALRSMEDKAIR